MEEEIRRSLKILQMGGIILYPTDTIWGLGCDATNENAVAKIYSIKKRESSKALITLVSNKKMLKNITISIPNIDITSLPTTVIYPVVVGIAQNVVAKDSSAAIRIVKDIFCEKLIEQFGKAIISTSANISGDQNPKQFSDISKIIIKHADYVVNLRKNERMETPSKIIKIETNGSITELRS